MSSFHNNLIVEFHWYDYLILIGVLSVGSILIGLIHTICKNDNNKKNYGRKGSKESGSINNGLPTSADSSSSQKLLSPIVVSFALFSSFITGNSILHDTDQIYLFGTQSIVTIITFVLVGLSLCYFYLPVYYNLELSSAFEYLQIRFSRSTRLIVSLLAIIQSILFLTIITYETSKGLQLMFADFNKTILCGVILIIATFSCLIGSLKSILYTNIFYALIIFGSLASIIGVGLAEFGGIEEIWFRAKNSSRIEFANFDPDLRAQNTLWTCLIAQYFILAAFFMSTNSTSQRLISMKTLFQARISILLLVLSLILVTIFCSIIGLLITTKYFDCGPFEEVFNSSDNNWEYVFPKFIADSSEILFPGICGLWFTAVLCASLNVISNILHGLGMTLICDYVQHYFPSLPEHILNIILKILMLVFSGIIFGIIFLMDGHKEFLPMLNGVFYILIGSTFGVFILGMFFPWANSKGSLLGVLASLSLMGYLIWGSHNYSVNNSLPKNQILPIQENICESPNNFTMRSIEMDKNFEIDCNCADIIISSDNSNESLSDTNYSLFNESFSLVAANISNTSNYSLAAEENEEEDDLSVANYYIISISQVWYPTFSCLITIVCGLLLSSIILRWTKKWKVAQECLSPPILKLWVKLFPTHIKSWIEPEDDLLFLCSRAFQFTPKSEESEINKDSLCGVHIQRLEN